MKKEMVFIFAGLLFLAIAIFFIIQNKFKDSLAEDLKDIQNLKIPEFSLINPDLNNSLIGNQTLSNCEEQDSACLAEQIRICNKTVIFLDKAEEKVKLDIKGIENEDCILVLYKGDLGLNCKIPKQTLNVTYETYDLSNSTLLQHKIIEYCL